MALLPRAVPTDSVNSRQHRGMLAQAINAILAKLGGYEKSNAWTPTDASGAGLTFATVSAEYYVIGNICFAMAFVTYPSTANGSTALIGGIPFPVPARNSARQFTLNYSSVAALAYLVNSANNIELVTNTGAGVTNAQMSGATLIFTAIYPIS